MPIPKPYSSTKKVHQLPIATQTPTIVAAMASSVGQHNLPIFTTAADMRNWTRQQKREGKRVALVPTMVRTHHCHCRCFAFSQLPSILILKGAFACLLRATSMKGTCPLSRQPGTVQAIP
jgi:hypothetical protein